MNYSAFVVCLGNETTWSFILLLSSLFQRISGAMAPQPSIVFVGTPYISPITSPSGFEPSAAPDSLIPLLPSSPLYPLDSGPSLQPELGGLCGLETAALDGVLQKTAVDCMGPLAKFVGDVICCPQFGSMMKILQGELSSSTGSLALNDTEAEICFGEATDFLANLGANDTLANLCSLKPDNLTRGLCPVSGVAKFEEIVSKSSLLEACTSIDPLKECCKPVCSRAINAAAMQLASTTLTSLAVNGNLSDHRDKQAVNDCEGLVLSWLARQLGPESANSVFRNLYSCKVNRGCPLIFKDPSSVVNACRGPSPQNFTCCMSLYSYISELQKQMLITNVQALNCVTFFGSMLMKKGVEIDLYSLCQVDLKDFSLQVHGEQGCLLRDIPSNVVDDKATGISFTCDLNDNIAAPWPSSSSQNSFSLCASSNSSFPALPAGPTSGLQGIRTVNVMNLRITAYALVFLLYFSKCI
ncbi:hypothetical protein KP509_35G040100 [Ceratopteris richardii]|uniref:SPARK domain-containing protein n=1 Tax=Ceratopteris richardii TaxID=49495 RepID=A0A8T2QG53_CERRI|nr:hypothetical protein KP509_35G040100 [Ceratopteris richardii]